MSKKRTLTDEELRAIAVMAWAEFEQPVMDIDFPEIEVGAVPYLVDDDLDLGPVAPVVRAERHPEPSVSGTRKISIRLPHYLLARLRREAARTGTKYQTLIARTLRTASAAWAAV
jgi:hypothetical protein